MKKSLRVIFAILSFFAISTTMAATCNGQQMGGGDVCFSTGKVAKNPLYTISAYDNKGEEYGWSASQTAYPLGEMMKITGASSLAKLDVAAWGYAPVDVTSSFIAQCGATIDTKHTYNIVVNSSPNATAPTDLSIVCTKQRVG